MTREWNYLYKYTDSLKQLEYEQSLNETEKIELVKEILDDAKSVCFFGGAGVSTASGIPDFRSKDGLYNKKSQGTEDKEFARFQPEYLLSHDCLYKKSKVFFKYLRTHMDFRDAEPNYAHRSLAKMEKDGKLHMVVTQNIDGLHQKAGSENVYEIHGTLNRCYCKKCGKEYDMNVLYDDTQEVPMCECGNMLRPDVTLYGEQLPDAFTEVIDNELWKCDCLIVAGTSLAVVPANLIPSYFSGKYLIIVNKEETQFDKYADVVYHGDICEFFKEVYPC